MADISAFPTLGPVLKVAGKIGNYTATTAVKAGQVVCFAATGVSESVIPCVAGAGTIPIGVAIYPASAGALVAVAETGSIVTVVNADDTTAIDTGDYLEMNDNAVGGTISAATLTASGATATPHYVVGIAIEDIAGGGTGMCRVMPMQIIQPNAS